MSKNFDGKNTISRLFLIGLLGLSIFACFLVFQSFIGELLIATILVTTFYAPYKKIENYFKGRSMLASFIMCFLIILIVIFPLANLIGYSAKRLVEAYNNADQFFTQDNFYATVDRISANSLVNKAIDLAGSEVDAKTFILQNADSVKEWILSGEGNDIIITSSKNILSGTASMLVSIIIVIFCMFFFFVDGEKMLKKLTHLTPISNKYDVAIFNKFKDVSYSILFSTFVTAIIQGIIGAVGFFIVGIPVFFPAISLAFASIIPYVGTALVWLPISVYLLLTGQIWQGIFMLIWGGVVIGSSDNIIKAYLIKDTAGVHPLFIFFSIVGGISLFGFWGLVYGPLIISLAVTVIHIYEAEFREVLDDN